MMNANALRCARKILCKYIRQQGLAAFLSLFPFLGVEIFDDIYIMNREKEEKFIIAEEFSIQIYQ